jgi:tetratricopeptide (TPR) repeat protein
LIDLGERQRGYEALEAMLRAHPESGVAPAALREYLDNVNASETGGDRRYLDRVIPTLESTELGQYAHYAYAESLERDGRLDAALARYLLVARKYPYPQGALWDDALFRAADLEAKAGQASAAIAHLEEMLGRRETAYMSGSYERGRYAQARYRIAELYRDAMRDRANARRHFELLFTDHKTSRLRDDAAWSAAVLAVQSGDRAGACRDLEALVREIPDSRFAPCAPMLCPTLRVKESKRGCADYIARGIPPEGR